MSSTTSERSSDEQRLAELGYAQELKRGWSSFSNFAISFSIISVLAGCFTSYGQAFNNGGPIAISIGWPVISCFILCVAFSMAELASAYPTAGGIYYWSSKLGGAGWGWFTGWFNLIGLIAVVASVDYAAASFLSATLSLYDVHFVFNFASTNAHYNAHVVFVLFALILLIHGLINIFSGHLVSIFNGVSVWWHVVGVAIIIVLLIAVPSHHASFSYVFTGRAFGTLPAQHVLVLRAAARLPADDVHDHRLRRVRPRLRGDDRSRRVGAQGRLALGLLLGRDRLVPAAGADLRRPEVPHLGDLQRRLPGGGDPGDGADQRRRQGRAADLDDRPAVLRDGVRHQRIADDVRVLA